MVKPKPLLLLTPEQMKVANIYDYGIVVSKNYAQCRAESAKLDELQNWVTRSLTK